MPSTPAAPRRPARLPLTATPDLAAYDAIIVNSSAGKDSQAALDVVAHAADRAAVMHRIIVLHADLGDVEWPGVPQLAAAQAQHYGLPFVVRRREQNGLLDLIHTRRRWPSSLARYCTSAMKRQPSRRFMTEHVRQLGLDRPARILNVLGLRAEESHHRAQHPVLAPDPGASNLTRRHVDTWLPIHALTTSQVWQRIHTSGVPHHSAYDHGTRRPVDRTKTRRFTRAISVYGAYPWRVLRVAHQEMNFFLVEVMFMAEVKLQRRDIGAIELSSWGRVVPASGVVPFEMVDDAGTQVGPVGIFLRDFTARGNRTGSVRSYAYALLRWWRFLLAVEVEWNRATSAETRDFVLWLQQARKPVADRRTASAAWAGTVNSVTRKEYLDDDYKPRTVRHSNAVLRTFYDFWIEEGQGPLINPVPLARQRGARPNAHHNPLEPFKHEGRLRYNPRVPKRRPRAMPDGAWNALFAALTSHRDRAILALAISTAARAAELLGLRACDIDWGEQLIRVRRKGSDAEQWLPATPEAFVWLRLYLTELPRLAPGDALWWTLRRRRGDGRPRRVELTYDALRAVLRRANELLGANWSMHDCRHTCALRMTRDKNLSLRDVQVLLGHAHLTTTQIYLEDDDQTVIRRVQQHQAEREQRAVQQARPVAGPEYAADDLSVLFGGANR